MKRYQLTIGIFLILISILLSFDISMAGNLSDDAEKHHWDTYVHIGASVGIYALTYELLPDDMNIWAKRGISFLTPIAVGLAKETFIDDNFSWKDVGEWTGGSALAASFTIIKGEF